MIKKNAEDGKGEEKQAKIRTRNRSGYGPYKEKMKKTEDNQIINLKFVFYFHISTSHETVSQETCIYTSCYFGLKKLTRQ